MGVVYLIVVLAGLAIALLWHFTSRPDAGDTDQLQLLEIDEDWEHAHLRQLDAAGRRRSGWWLAGLAAVGALIAGTVVAQAFEPVRELVASATPSPEPSARPHLITIEATPSPSPTPSPTPVPTPTPPSAPQAAVAPAPSPAAGSLTAEVSGSCEGGKLTASYTFHAHEGLTWFTLFVDGSAVRGGPIDGIDHSGSHTVDAASAEHDVEVTVEDAAGARVVDRALVICP